MAEMPAVISDSIRDVLRARGLTLPPEAVIVELGKNAAHRLSSIDETTQDAAPAPPPIELLSVGHTLRMLARTAPGEGTGAAMTRVGEWLIEQAAEAMAKGCKAA